MIDTHCHLTFPELSSRVGEVIAAAAEFKVNRMISIGTTPRDAMNALKIAEAHEQVWFAAGIHPHYAEEIDDLPTACQQLKDLAKHPRHVAVGEMGIDYHYDDPPKEKQFECFEAQLQVVKDLEAEGIVKPVIIHSRKATDDSVAIIRNSGIPGERFVYHCFTESPEDAQKVLDLGAMISFTGIVTYRNAPAVRESCMLVPRDRMMLETDSPYLSPEPHRKVRPNEPKHVYWVAEYIAQLKKIPVGELKYYCDQNAERFFGII